jgi:serine/threonine-protein kinase
VRDVAEPAGAGTELRLGDSSRTRDGSLLGTLGYMPPEQMEAAERVDARADVYALGAILFEILAGERLHPATDVMAMITSTQDGVEGRPSRRVPQREVPPELDDACARATAHVTADRHPDVTALVDDVQRYLDGDRDLARRRQLADEHTERARERLALAPGDNDVRATAMREVGHAVAFDPDHAGAMALLSRLLLEPPSKIPPEVDARIEAGEDERGLLQAKIGAQSGAGWLLLVPVLGWMGVRDWSAIGLFVVVMLTVVVASWRQVVRGRATAESLHFIAVLVGLIIVMSSFIFGPLILTPALAAMTVGMFMLEPDRGDHRWFLVGGVATVAVPLALELTGVLAPSLTFGADTMTVHADIAAFNPLPTLLLLGGASIASILVIGQTVAKVTSALRDSQRRLALYAWHLDQLLPSKSG